MSADATIFDPLKEILNLLTTSNVNISTLLDKLLSIIVAYDKFWLSIKDYIEEPLSNDDLIIWPSANQVNPIQLIQTILRLQPELHSSILGLAHSSDILLVVHKSDFIGGKTALDSLYRLYKKRELTIQTGIPEIREYQRQQLRKIHADFVAMLADIGAKKHVETVYFTKLLRRMYTVIALARPFLADQWDGFDLFLSDDSMDIDSSSSSSSSHRRSSATSVAVLVGAPISISDNSMKRLNKLANMVKQIFDYDSLPTVKLFERVLMQIILVLSSPGINLMDEDVDKIVRSPTKSTNGEGRKKRQILEK